MKVQDEIVKKTENMMCWHSEDSLVIHEAIIAIILNTCVLAGAGTIFAGGRRFDCNGNLKPNRYKCLGIIQILLSPLLIGWIWALVISIQIMRSSSNHC